MNESGKVVAVLGCGLIGESWAALFIRHGLDVLAWDPNPAALEGFAGRLERPLAQLRELGIGSERHGNLQVAARLEDAVATACWIQENAPENVPLKRELYDRIEAVAASDAVIASSTSSLTWSELAADLQHSERFVTAHPFNPPHLMPLVEIYASNGAMAERARDFYEALGRKTVALKKDAVGHIANRLSSALWREAVNIVAEGIADVSAVDAALVHGPGLRWSVIGAHMAYHLGGGPGGIEHYLRHLGPSQERRWATLGSPSLTPQVCALLVDGIASEAAGRPIAVLEEERDRALMRALVAREETDDR
ncbi:MULTISPECIES: 3-hydroxyacyl-CoA dehydrogenase NAD-binding domain-containing protein [Rhizobiaceae]|uniref:3-hydroxyacyl-CoA dehydrogenase NAD-binding domain-containing protein n=1 Tax=Rhizobiaceae TaxID=82115 RepID=UPI002412A8E2|nr:MULTISPECIES: 3-hydroxyacyl-CoA dehydrogenase NAD-binding domain-containing protein [Rhizobiaceae]MDG3580294.1 3-hydroxyacyl-CoA dehydrogenase NAD-binding domain-containing protein [Rhizobium sp. YJ-22]